MAEKATSLAGERTQLSGDFYYFPEGGGWSLYRIVDNKIVAQTEDYNMGSHNAAGDHFSGADENIDDLDWIEDDEVREALFQLCFDGDEKNGDFYV